MTDQDLQTFHIYENLISLNEWPPADAESAFLDCCGSRTWARRMATARPFAMLEDLFDSAERIWFALSPSDWLEAFAAHPRIGSSKAALTQQARAGAWSAGEQSGVDSAEEKVRNELGLANSLYQDKFGFIFIVCATGKTAEELLAICRARLGNSAQTEFAIAAGEQHKITEIRLNRLLEQ